MTPIQIEIATKLAAHKNFRWYVGVRAVRGEESYRFTEFDDEEADGSYGRMVGGWIPDLDDWPTIGSLLGRLVAVSYNLLIESSRNTDWQIWLDVNRDIEPCHIAPTLGEAVAYALLEAWNRAKG